ncbi:MAG: hypothetical protein ACOYL8_00900 [Patescibacteria group bacterium]
MITNNQKNKNSLNIFLNDYFNIVIVFIVIIVLAASYFIVIQPKYDETMAAIKSNIEQQQKIYTDQQKKLESLKTISDLYSKISPSDLKKFNGVLPDDYVKESLFGELDEIITANGFILNSVSVTKEGENADGTKVAGLGKVSQVNIKLSLGSVSYNGFKNLLKLLETNLRLFDITQLNFTPDSNAVSFSLTTYYYNK